MSCSLSLSIFIHFLAKLIILKSKNIDIYMLFSLFIFQADGETQLMLL